MKVAIIYNQDFSSVINQFGMQNKEKYNPKTVKRIANALELGGHNVRIIDGNMDVIRHLQDFMPRVLDGERMGMVFNMAYGIQGESRYTHLPSMLEMLGIPYVGSGPAGHALALDKVITKIILEKHGLPTPEFWVFSDPDENMDEVPFPVIVKPKMEAVSYGLRIVDNVEDLRDAVGFITAEFQQQALVERFIRGREFAVGLLGNNSGLETFPVVEIDLEGDPDAIQSVDDKKRHPRGKICPAQLPENIAEEMVRISRAAFSALALRDFARVDLRMDDDQNIHILEINSMASLGVTGSYVYSAGVAGYDYNQLVNRILDVATVRYFAESTTPWEEKKGDKQKRGRQSLPVRMRGFLRSNQDRTEKLLKKMAGLNTHVRNVEGVNALGQLIWDQLSPLGFNLQVIPQVESGNILLVSNTQDPKYDVLLIGSLDCMVPFSKQAPYKQDQEKTYGTAIWENKGGLAVMVAALQALRFVRVLKKLKIGILLTADESLQGRFSRNHVEMISTRARSVIGLSGGSIQSSAVTSRSGASVYNIQMNLKEAPSAEAVAKTIAIYSRLVAEIAQLSDEKRGLISSPREVAIHSNLSERSATGELAVSVRFSERELAVEFDQKIKKIIQKNRKKKIQIHMDGGMRRPPMLRSEKVGEMWDLISSIAKKLDIRLLEEHRWSSGNICFVGGDKPLLDGMGPVGGPSDRSGEFILRHSIMERAAMLAILLHKLGKGGLT